MSLGGNEPWPPPSPPQQRAHKYSPPSPVPPTFPPTTTTTVSPRRTRIFVARLLPTGRLSVTAPGVGGGRRQQMRCRWDCSINRIKADGGGGGLRADAHRSLIYDSKHRFITRPRPESSLSGSLTTTGTDSRNSWKIGFSTVCRVPSFLEYNLSSPHTDEPQVFMLFKISSTPKKCNAIGCCGCDLSQRSRATCDTLSTSSMSRVIYYYCNYDRNLNRWSHRPLNTFVDL